MDAWLEKDTNPTWERLADAFDYAGQRALAKRIRETYNCECVIILCALPDISVFRYSETYTIYCKAI